VPFHIYTGAGGSRFVGDHKLGPVVARISRAADAPINSHARDQAAAAQLHQLGQHTQAEVIVLHAQGVPGFGPANPVKATTHCRYNDGVAYRFWPWGFRIPWWARGIDVRPDRVAAFCREAAREGFTVTATYPGSVGEAQHVNFRRLPSLFRELRHGSRGQRVRWVQRWLVKIGDLKAGTFKAGHYDRATLTGVERFQRHHHLEPDGVYGPHTSASFRARVRRYRKDHR
jgi:hypothetical protein